jgi:cysteine desulfurase
MFGAMRRIYLDHNATTPLLPEAADAMRPWLDGRFGNPASAHWAGRHARQALESARERVADLLGAFPDEVVFTSGATESNNLALFGLAGDPPGHVLAGPVEHPCVAEPIRRLADAGFAVEYLPVGADGVVPSDALRGRLGPDTRLVTVMLANHETGAVQPVRDLSFVLCPLSFENASERADAPSKDEGRRTKDKGQRTHFHCDAAQAVGKMPVRFRELGVTTLSASAHKFNGPQGVGLLLVLRGATLRPLFWGGHQQQGRRPGTEPVALAVGLAAALEYRIRHLESTDAHVRRLRQRFLERVRVLAEPLVLNGPAEAGLPHTINLSFPGCRAEALLIALDLAGVACSTGSACSSGSLLPSPVLRAMNVPDDVLHSAMRFSLGPSNDVADIDDAAERIGRAVARLRSVGDD